MCSLAYFLSSSRSCVSQCNVFMACVVKGWALLQVADGIGSAGVGSKGDLQPA